MAVSIDPASAPDWAPPRSARSRSTRPSRAGSGHSCRFLVSIALTRSPSTALLVLLSAATGAPLVASDLHGRPRWPHRSVVIEIACCGQLCQLLGSSIGCRLSKTCPPRRGLGDIVDRGLALLHALEERSPRRRLNVVELRASNCLWVDEPLVVRPTKRGEDGEGFDVRAL